MTNTPTPTEIREGRMALNLSQRQFADLMGYGHKNRIHELEQGMKAMAGPSTKMFRLVTGETTIDAEIKKVREKQK